MVKGYNLKTTISFFMLATDQPACSLLEKVLVAAFRNRNLPVPEVAQELHEIHDKEAGNDEILQRTDQFK